MNKAKLIATIVVVMILAFTGNVGAVEEEKPLDNAQVIKMTKADLGDTIIIAKIKSAQAVNFNLTTDDLMALKAAGVSQDVIAAMLDRTAPKNSANQSAAGEPKVVLVTNAGELELKPTDGEVKTIVAPFVGMKRFIVFSELNAAIRTKDRRPAILIWIDRNPKENYWFVKLDQDDDEEDMDRSLDVRSPGAWGGVLSSAPEKDFIVKCTIAEEKPGLWSFKAIKDLKPGEYALYVSRSEMAGSIYDFSVEK
ncbi:MAG: hypothetical protein JXI33_04860 [Candidatus Aminicenantes bacterium]|nr:hypothetical protein [Candidatus Aminicenantes bacterium]